jgi:hypothetical protein
VQRVLSTDLWTEVSKKARASKSRKAAIAFVTRDLVGFRKGDTLVVNASVRAIKNGDTDAQLLRKLFEKGVRLYDCATLHAKTLLPRDVAIIGSGNMSSNSSKLVEAALMSDHGSVVAGVASFIEQLVKQSPPLDGAQISELCKIEVIRRGGWAGTPPKKKPRISKLGGRTWIVGVDEGELDMKPEEQRRVERSLQKRVGTGDADFTQIKWDPRDRFARDCREGDLLIQIWCSSRAKQPDAVLKAVPVLLKQKPKLCTEFYVPQSTRRDSRITWKQFQRILREIGYSRKVTENSVQEVASDMADAINRQWNSAAKN